MERFMSTKVLELGSCAFRQPKASHSHCRYLHGYRLTAKFWFECGELDQNNWVVDFGCLDPLKKKLRDQFDHTLCVAVDDPVLPILEELRKADACDLRVMSNGVGIERVAEYCFNEADAFVRASTSNRCWVHHVEVWEHDNNSAEYWRTDSSLDVPAPDPVEEEPSVEVQPASNEAAHAPEEPTHHSGNSSLTTGLHDPPKHADSARPKDEDDEFMNRKPSSITDTDPSKKTWEFGTKWF